jgi:uncharacterized protein YhaN
MNLNQNLNIIYGDIENGKSTIVSFIKMMFYGAKSIKENPDKLTNERLRYRPYDDFDCKMGGSMSFTMDGIQYTLDRTFNDSNATDIVKLYNATQDTFLDVNGENVGQYIFNVSKETFEKATFIDDVNANSKDEKSTQKLLNLISSYDENVSAETVKSTLLDTKEAYLSKSGKIGILDKNKATLLSLHEDIANAQAEESQKIQMQIEYEAVQYNRDEIVDRYEELRKTLTIQQTMTEVNTLKSTVAKLDSLRELENEVSARKKALSNDKVTVDDKFMQDVQQKLNNIQQLGELKNQYQSNVYKLKSEVDTMNETLKDSHVEEHRLYDEAVEQIEYTHGHIDNLNKAINDNKKELESLSESIKEADVNVRVIDEQVKTKKDLDQQRLDMAQKMLEDARKPMTYTETVSNSSFVYIGVIICILGILLTFTVNTKCLLVIGLGIVIEMLTFLSKHNSSIKDSAKYERVDTIAISKANENIQNVRHDIEMEQYSLNKKHREAQKQLNLLKLKEEQILGDCDKYQEQIKTLEKNLEYWNAQRDETQAVFATEQAKVDKKQNELDTLLENISDAEERFYTAQEDIIRYVSAFKPCTNLTDVSKVVNYLNVEFENIRNLQQRLDYQTELLKTETNGQSYEELRDKLTDITEDFIEMCGRDNPQPMSVAELSQLKAEIDDCQFSLNMQNADLSYISSDIKAKFRNRTSVTEIEHEINSIERKIVKQEKFCHSLDLAVEVLQQSIDEIKGYNATLSENVSSIFSNLIDDSYDSIAIRKTLDTAIQNDNSFENWKYLCHGTVEQAYISLRLGVAKMVSDSNFNAPLPILLDDTFIQYDNENSLKELQFIKDYTEDSQVIMFTSHKNIADYINKNGVSAELVSLN